MAEAFKGHHSEWNLGSPGGWDYQRLARIIIEKDELEIARMNPWGGSAAIIASDGLFSFGVEPRTED